MDWNNLNVDVADGIARITIDRPKALNALNTETLEELQAVFTDLEQNNRVQVVIITGAGSKAFVAGADIAAMQPLSALEAREFAKLGHGVLGQIESCSKPVIAAINGFALGGGCELAMSCDIRIAAQSARFSQPEVNLGVIPGFGGTQRLPRLVGKGVALQLLLTGEMIDAAEAERIGLVNLVVPQEELLERAETMARTICEKGRYAIRLVKEAVQTGLEIDLERANRYETELFGLCFASRDQKEGMAAFLEKRPAKFTGS